MASCRCQSRPPFFFFFFFFFFPWNGRIVASPVRVDVVANRLQDVTCSCLFGGGRHLAFAARFGAGTPPCALVSTSGQASSSDRT